MKKIGIMGGTFNPIHDGHLKMALEAYKQYQLDEVWFMPTKQPPHKNNSDIIKDEHRVNMIELAIKPFPFFFLSKLELEREGTTYTIDTLCQLKKEYPEHYFYFILGSDSLFEIHTWKCPKEVMELAHILSAPRYPRTVEEDYIRKEQLEKEYNADIQFIDMEQITVSSMDIRKKFFDKKSANEYLPKEVEQYIEQYHLYQESSDKNESGI